MSEKSQSARPNQVTLAGWVAVLGCALLVATLFDSVSNLQTVQFRDTIDEFLSTPPGSGLGLEIPQVVEILRVLMLFSGAAAAAALVLAVFVLQRHRGARLGYTIAAVAIVLTAPVSGSLAPIMIAFAAIMLWTRPARDWFDGVTPASSTRTHAADKRPHRAEGKLLSQDNNPHEQPDEPRPAPGHDPGTGGDDRPSWPRMPDDSAGRPVPPPTQGYGQGQAQAQGQGQGYGQPPHQGQSYGQPQYGQPQYGQGQPPGSGYPQYGAGPQGYGSAPRRGAQTRPTTVTIAAWVTWVLSALALLGFVLIAFVLLAARDEFLRQVQRDPNFQQLDVPTDQLVGGLWVVGAIALFWGVAAMVLAWFAYRRANWARITLVVSAAMTAVFSLLTFPVGLVHILGSIAVIVLLFTGGANEWYARQGQGGFPGGFAPYGGSAPQGYAGYPGQEGQQPPGQYGQPGQQGHPDQYGQQGQQGRPDQHGQPGEQGRGGRGKDEPPSNVW